ncbi:MFS general substrate transporter [Chloropicon primus]|nr:MFS general substrate transporter [Chloropicon primus]
MRSHDYRRFGSLLSALYLELLGGGVYAFSVYSGKLHQLGLRQEEVQLIATSGNLGAWLLLPAGYFFDRYGPSVGILLGCVLTGLGYALLYLVFTARMTASLPLLCVGAFMAQHGGGYWDGSAVPMATKNFAPDKGLVLGLLKGFFGISASVITVLYQSYFRPNISSFILVLSVGLPAGALATILGADLTKGQILALTLEERTRVAVLGYGLLAVLVVYISCSSIYQREASYAILGSFLWVLIAGFGALYLPLRVPAEIGRRLGLNFNKSPAAEGDGDEEGERQDATLLPPSDPPEAGRQSRYGSVLRQREFWHVFVICSVVMGSGITLINNVHDLVVSLAMDGESGTAGDTYVVLISVGSCMGRAGVGLLSDSYSSVWSRPTFVLANCLLMMSAQLTLCIANLNALYVSCIVCGMAFGAMFTLLPCTLADLYGHEDFAFLAFRLKRSTDDRARK